MKRDVSVYGCKEIMWRHVDRLVLVGLLQLDVDEAVPLFSPCEFSSYKFDL